MTVVTVFLTCCRLLYTFLQQQQKQDKKVNATYFLAGLSKGDNGAVVREEFFFSKVANGFAKRKTSEYSCFLFLL